MTTTRPRRTTTERTAPATTAAWLLFGNDEQAVARLVDAIAAGPVLDSLRGSLGSLSAAARTAVGTRVGEIATGLAALDLADVLAAGWRKHTALREAARRTLADPGSIELVDLATHRIRSAHQPTVDVLVDERKVATVEFSLELSFLLQGLVAGVRDGRLMALHSGDCEAVGVLSVEGIELARRQRELDLELALDLDAGVPLLTRKAPRP